MSHYQNVSSFAQEWLRVISCAVNWEGPCVFTNPPIPDLGLLGRWRDVWVADTTIEASVVHFSCRSSLVNVIWAPSCLDEPAFRSGGTWWVKVALEGLEVHTTSSLSQFPLSSTSTSFEVRAFQGHENKFASYIITKHTSPSGSWMNSSDAAATDLLGKTVMTKGWRGSHRILTREARWMRRFVEETAIGQVELQEIAVGHRRGRVIIEERFERVEAGSSRHWHTAHLHSESSPHS